MKILVNTRFHFFARQRLKFQSIVTSKLSTNQLPSLNEITETVVQIDNMITTFTNAILKGQEKSVPLISPKPYAINITPEIKLKIQTRNTLKRRLQRNPNLVLLLRPQINRLSQEIKSDINFIANANFQHKLSHNNQRRQSSIAMANLKIPKK